MGRVEVQGLGKAYKLYPSRWARLAQWLLPGTQARHTLKWVIRDISFTLEPGHAMGIIGINGAGKSTLLKMITGTTQPTAGQVHMSGRVAALLELGMGFHPDFTGRQNAVMAAQLMGLAATDIDALLPGIEAFSEIGSYFDQPLRVYSSGMQVRLAFSVATAVRPDVLIVDEALSVGDAYFQHKSFERIRHFRDQGTTLLLVSHDKTAIQAVCDEALLLDSGGIALRGKPEAVMDYYNALIAERENRTVQQETLADGTVRTRSGTGEARVISLRLLDAQGQPLEVVGVGQAVRLEVTVQAQVALAQLVVGYMIKDRLGQPVFGTNTHHLGQALGPLNAGDEQVLCFDFAAQLGEGSFSVAVALTDSETHLTRNYEWTDLALVFQVVNMAQPAFVGLAFLPPTMFIGPLKKGDRSI